MIYGPKCFHEDGVTSRRAWPIYPQGQKNLLFPVKPPERRPSSPNAASIATLTEADPAILEPSLHDILSAVGAVTGIAIVDLASPRRERRFVRARFVYFHVARTLTSKSTPNIGRHCGRRDHSTVLHGLHQVQLHPAEYAEKIAAVRAAVSGYHRAIACQPMEGRG